MTDTVEKIIFLLLGATVGAVVGVIMVAHPMDWFSHEHDPLVISMAVILGILISRLILFYQKDKIAREEGKVRNETIALITHEMRTALTSTSWAIPYILEHYKEHIIPKDKKMLEDILKSIRTTVMHTVNLLDVSLLDIGKLSISLEWVKLPQVEEMIREVLEKYAMGMEREGIKFDSIVKLDAEREVEVDMLRMRIILENLLENSIQYTKNAVKEIKVEITNTPTTLNMMVSDSGIGIPYDEQDRVFSEFYRASNARKILSSGSGIGLHMCAQYVKAHHGTIRFESKEGEGTTFYISLPLKTIADTQEFLKNI